VTTNHDFVPPQSCKQQKPTADILRRACDASPVGQQAGKLGVWTMFCPLLTLKLVIWKTHPSCQCLHVSTLLSCMYHGVMLYDINLAFLTATGTQVESLTSRSDMRLLDVIFVG
jgi:hypothetical protein